MPSSTSRESRRAIVIGAGLAGAAACVHLARRGWHIDLIDRHSGPAMAASALPVGMLSPHVTRSPTPLSRLTALGVPLTRQELEAGVQQGRGWQTCEVDNLGADAGRWPAALVRPAALVQAWLDEAGQRARLVCHWSSTVASITRNEAANGGPCWRVADSHDRTLAEAPAVVLASALGSLALVTAIDSRCDRTALPLHPVKGQLSLGALEGPALAPRPRRDQGVYVPCYDDEGLLPLWPGRLWAMGSTYERGQDDRSLTEEAHQRNAASLERLAPAAAERLRTELLAGRLLGWSEVRCASLDRLPLVGSCPDLQAFHEDALQMPRRRRMPSLSEMPRMSGLYLLCALGSRGLSLSALCGRLLAAQMDNDQVPGMPDDLVAALDPARFAWRRARRQPT